MEKAIYKVCSVCGKKKPVCEFNKRKANKDGIAPLCKKCKKQKDKSYRLKNKKKISERSKEYYKDNREKRLESSKEYYKNNKEQQLETTRKWRKENSGQIKNYYSDNREENLKRSKEYYKNNKEQQLESAKKWRENNPEKLELTRIKDKERNKERYKNDLLYKIKEDTRNVIRSSFYSGNYTKRSRTYEILGCSYEDFKIHIEDQFEGWMNWGNRGIYTGNLNETWQYDHIISISSAKSEEDIIKLNHYTNFQPLCSYVNQYIKRDKEDFM